MNAKYRISGDIRQQLENARMEGQKIVLVTGVFDILHRAHRKFLVQARTQGDFLIVGVESDKRVKELKGEDRPINPAEKRAEQVLNLGVPDAVFILPEEFSEYVDHVSLVQLISPDILAISSNTPNQEAKKKVMKEVGGKLVVVMEEDRGVSTSKMIRIMNE